MPHQWEILHFGCHLEDFGPHFTSQNDSTFIESTVTVLRAPSSALHGKCRAREQQWDITWRKTGDDIIGHSGDT